MIVQKLDDNAWSTLLDSIGWGKCTPFLGAGVNYPFLPTGKAIAQRWAKDYGYPLRADEDDLAKVAQFLAIRRGGIWPKRAIAQEFRAITTPQDFDAYDNPLGILAELPLPIYITTNYDNCLMDALKMKGKQPKLDICRWNSALNLIEPVFNKKSRFVPTEKEPVVFHVHGHQDWPESLVLTEDDYLEFLVSLSRNKELLARRIQEALAYTSLLFIGYRLADWDLRVLLHGLLKTTEKSLRSLSISVQLPPELPAEQQENALSYLESYFGELDLRVFWGNARDFARKLRQLWEQSRLVKDTSNVH